MPVSGAQGEVCYSTHLPKLKIVAYLFPFDSVAPVGHGARFALPDSGVQSKVCYSTNLPNMKSIT